MEMDRKETIKELLGKIERRFQFLMIIALFLPNVWDGVQKILSGIFPQISEQLSIGLILTYIFTSYLWFELFKKVMSVKRIFLELTTYSLITLSYVMVVVIGYLSTAKNLSLIGRQLFFFELAVGVIPFILLFTIFVFIIATLTGYYSAIRNILSKKKHNS